MRDSSNRDAKSLRAKRLKAELGYPALLFYCLSNITHLAHSLLLFLLFVSRISLTLICPFSSSYPASRLLESALQALRISHPAYSNLLFQLFVSRLRAPALQALRIPHLVYAHLPFSSSYPASRLLVSALLLFQIARYKKGRS